MKNSNDIVLYDIAELLTYITSEPCHHNQFKYFIESCFSYSLMRALGDRSMQPKREKMAFKKMENISKFLTSAERYGLPVTELFQTVDLYERQNIGQVIQTLFALGRKVNISTQLSCLELQ